MPGLPERVQEVALGPDERAIQGLVHVCTQRSMIGSYGGIWALCGPELGHPSAHVSCR